MITTDAGEREVSSSRQRRLVPRCWRGVLLAPLVPGLLAAGWGCAQAAVPKPPEEPRAAAAVAQPAAVRPPAQEHSISDRPTVEVRRETLRRFAPAVGSFRARRTTRLGPQVAGRVQEVLVDVGDTVKTDQVLVRLDPAFFEIEVNQNKAAAEATRSALDSAVVDVADTEREMRRQIDLFQQGAGSTKDRDDAVTRYDRAVAKRAEQAARFTEAQRKLEYAEERLKETQIRAPYDGAVTARLVDPGEPAASTPPTHLLEIQEVGVLYLEYSLPQELLGLVRVGTLVEFDVEGVDGGATPGTTSVAVIFPAIDEATRSFRCRSVIENLGRKLQPGLLARVRVLAEEARDALVLPRSALHQTAGGWQATVSNDGHPVPRPVEVGLITDDAAQIVSGLKEGDRIFVAANGRN